MNDRDDDRTLMVGAILVLGPLVGFAVGAAGSWLVGEVDRRFAIGREYQALHGVGLVLAASVGGEAVGGDGFLAAFAAGLAVKVFTNQFCDCFLEYGEITAEMTMLLAFILFGAVLSVLIPTIDLSPVLLVGCSVIFLVRPLVITPVLPPARLSPAAQLFIG